MFGYIRARQDTLPEGAEKEYEAVYCGLCHTMARRHGGFSRFFLNYDFTFLAMLLDPAQSEGEIVRCRCAPHPIKGRYTCLEQPWLNLAADESVILTWWKLRDNLDDGGFWTRLGAGLLMCGLRHGYRVGQRACPDFNRQVRILLEELHCLEEEYCSSIDRTADCFARILCAAAPASGTAARDRAIALLLYHIGRWIYLIDAVDDRDRDRKSGSYNPLLIRYPQWTDEDQKALRTTMDHSLSLAASAFELLERNRWSPLVENIIYSGLPGVEEMVFSGQWRDYQKRHRRNT